MTCTAFLFSVIFLNWKLYRELMGCQSNGMSFDKHSSVLCTLYRLDSEFFLVEEIASIKNL